MTTQPLSKCEVLSLVCLFMALADFAMIPLLNATHTKSLFSFSDILWLSGPQVTLAHDTKLKATRSTSCSCMPICTLSTLIFFFSPRHRSKGGNFHVVTEHMDRMFYLVHWINWRNQNRWTGVPDLLSSKKLNNTSYHHAEISTKSWSRGFGG